MSQVYNYIFGDDGKIKSKSNKPILDTIRDAIIVSIVSMIVSIIILIAYNYIIERTIDTPTHEFWLAAAQGFVISIVTQCLYEYMGINSMLAESSIRYAKGNTLQKYKSYHSAILYECLYKLLNNLNTFDSAVPSVITIKQRFKILKILTLHPEILSTPNLSPALLQKAQLVRSIPEENLPAIRLVTIHITNALIYDILYNGFTNYTVSNSIKKYMADEVNKEQIAAGTKRGELIIHQIEAVDN